MTKSSIMAYYKGKAVYDPTSRGMEPVEVTFYDNGVLSDETLVSHFNFVNKWNLPEQISTRESPKVNYYVVSVFLGATPLLDMRCY